MYITRSRQRSWVRKSLGPFSLLSIIYAYYIYLLYADGQQRKGARPDLYNKEDSAIEAVNLDGSMCPTYFD
jgi:hypothetical protein